GNVRSGQYHIAIGSQCNPTEQARAAHADHMRVERMTGDIKRMELEIAVRRATKVDVRSIWRQCHSGQIIASGRAVDPCVDEVAAAVELGDAKIIVAALRGEA